MLIACRKGGLANWPQFLPDIVAVTGAHIFVCSWFANIAVSCRLSNITNRQKWAGALSCVQNGPALLSVSPETCDPH